MPNAEAVESIPMDMVVTVRPDPLTLILAAETFDALRLASLAPVEAALGEGSVRALSFLILREEDLHTALFITPERGAQRRFFRPHRVDARILDLLADPERGPILLDGEPDQYVDPFPPSAPTPWAQTLLVPIRGAARPIGALWVALARPVRLDSAAIAALAGFGDLLALAAGRVLKFEESIAQNEQLRLLHEALHKAMVCMDREALLAMFLSILNRQFRLSRVLIALVHPETGMLRSEMQTRFQPRLKVKAVPAGDNHNPLAAVMNRGEIQVIDEPQRLLEEWMEEEGQLEPAERGVALPLFIGNRALGVIYADQRQHDGAPLFRTVLETFARLAAAALENLRLRSSAEQRAETDPLTGLRNRAFLDRILEMEIPRVKRYNSPISLLMIDLCDFKRTNDSWGHPFGDYILRETARILQATVRGHDVLVRWGGDEFVVLMVNTSHDQADRVRRRIEQSFTDRNRLQTDERMMISISIGLRSADANTIENLIYDADQAMYAQKARQKRVQLIAALLSGNLERIEAADRVVGSLCNMLYRKAPYYHDHSRRVTHLALKLGRRLGLPTDELEVLALAALLHDIGKASLPPEILQKSTALSPPEVEALRHHPELGEQFFQGIEHLEPVRPLIRSHHERFDSELSGKFPSYPDGISGEWIPLGARILRLAEFADSMLMQRPYRPALGRATAESLIREESGKAFDPRLVGLLLDDPDWDAALDVPGAVERLLKGD